jgi:hypothetical protein
MMKLLLLVLILPFAALTASAQEAPRVEVFGGYSFARADLAGASANLHGLAGSVTYNFDNFLGVKADFSGHTGSKTIFVPADPAGTVPFDLRPSDFTFLFGPQMTYRKKQTIIPFGHVLLGGVNPINASQTGTSTSVTFVDGSDTGFGLAFGGGLDVKLSKRVALRIVQADYLLAFTEGDTQNNIRLSTGLVFRFGK